VIIFVKYENHQFGRLRCIVYWQEDKQVLLVYSGAAEIVDQTGLLEII
jgi:hypothetical protein